MILHSPSHASHYGQIVQIYSAFHIVFLHATAIKYLIFPVVKVIKPLSNLSINLET